MKSKSSLPVRSEVLRPPFRGRGWLRWCVGLSLIVGGALGSSAQAPGPGSASKPQAYVRFWNMLVGPGGMDLQLIAAEDRPITTAPPGNSYAGYVPVDPGSYTFTVRKPGDPNAVLKRVAVVLRADVYITLLAAQSKDGRPDVQMLDDTVDPKADNGGKLIVRQFFAGATVTVGVGGPAAGTPLAFGESAVLDNLPVRNTAVNMQANGLPGGPKNWSVEVDFASGHRATMLAIADAYGRFRPRIVFDGASRKPVPPPDNGGKPGAPGTSPKP